MFAYTAACGTRNHLLSVIAQMLAHAALYCAGGHFHERSAKKDFETTRNRQAKWPKWMRPSRRSGFLYAEPFLRGHSQILTQNHGLRASYYVLRPFPVAIHEKRFRDDERGQAQWPKWCGPASLYVINRLPAIPSARNSL